jgi:hypothetical protein
VDDECLLEELDLSGFVCIYLSLSGWRVNVVQDAMGPIARLRGFGEVKSLGEVSMSLFVSFFGRSRGRLNQTIRLQPRRWVKLL